MSYSPVHYRSWRRADIIPWANRFSDAVVIHCHDKIRCYASAGMMDQYANHPPTQNDITFPYIGGPTNCCDNAYSICAFDIDSPDIYESRRTTLDHEDSRNYAPKLRQTTRLSDYRAAAADYKSRLMSRFLPRTINAVQYKD